MPDRIQETYYKAVGSEIIWRWGIYQEQLEALQQSSAEAYEVINIHGVTAFAGTTPIQANVSYAKVDDLVAGGFSVFVTPLNSTSEHRTVELPYPVTPEIVEIWNKLWKRRKRDETNL